MGAFGEHIAEDVSRELQRPRYQSAQAHYSGQGGRVFFVLKTSATNYSQFVQDHPDYKSGDGVVTVAAVYNTVDAAIGACTAGQGDKIYVMEGHTEAVTSSSLTLDIAGVTVINLGQGQNQCVYTYGAAAATITVSAANVKWVGGYFTGNFDNVAAAFTIGAAKDFCLDGGQFVDNSDALHFVSIVVTGSTANAADGLTVKNCYWLGLAIAPNAVVSVLGDLNRLHLHDNFADMAATNDVGHFVTVAAKVVLGARIHHNQLNVVGSTGAAVGIFMTGSSTTNTGMIWNNYVTSLDTTAALFVTAAINLAVHENYVSGVVAGSGTLLPAADNPA